MVMAPVVRGRKGEFEKLFEQFRLGVCRVRVDGELRRLDEEIKLDKKYNHDISVVVDWLVMKSDLRRRLSESIEAAPPRRWRGRGRHRQRRVRSRCGESQGVDRNDRAKGAKGAKGAGELPPDVTDQLTFSERFARLNCGLDPRARAADLLLQLAARRLRALPRARLPASGGPRSGRPGPDALPLGGSAAAVAPRTLPLLEAPRRGRGGGLRDRLRRPAGAPMRTRRSSSTAPAASATRSPTRTALGDVAPTASASRDRQQPRAPLRGDGLRRGPGKGRGLHGRAALPGLQGRQAAAGEPRGQGRGISIHDYTGPSPAPP